MPRKAASPKRSGARRKPTKSAKKPAPRKAAKKATPRAAHKAAATATAAPGRVEVRNVNVPGYRNTVDAAKYGSMRATLFAVLPRSPPGLTQGEMLEAALPKLSQEHFPRGDKAMWWIKTVQLDQEARGAIKRSDTKPLRWWRVS